MPSAIERLCDAFWIPFKSDTEELLGRFQLTESVRYEDFAATWRAMDFSAVFYGMTTRHEKRPFSRLVFATVYGYFLPPYNFQIRVGALYMFYGLYHTQPAWPKEKIWIALKDWVHVQKFLFDAVSCKHLDVVYIYKKLVSEKAFYFTAMPKQLLFDAKRRYMNKDVNEEFQDRTTKVADLLNAVTMEEISNVQTHYEQIKQAMATSVSVTPINLTAHLQECAHAFQQWQEKNACKQALKNKAKDTSQPESRKRADLLSSIKSKSYGHHSKASRSRRHRHVEMDHSESGADHAQKFMMPQKRKPLSLRERTWQTLGKEENSEAQRQHWLLSSKEDDRAAMKRTQQQHRFKW